MTLVTIDSSMLSAVGYDPTTVELEAVLRDGAIWRYQNMPEHVFQELMASDSKGSSLRDVIIDMYPDYSGRRRP